MYVLLLKLLTYLTFLLFSPYNKAHKHLKPFVKWYTCTCFYILWFLSYLHVPLIVTSWFMKYLVFWKLITWTISRGECERVLSTYSFNSTFRTLIAFTYWLCRSANTGLLLKWSSLGVSLWDVTGKYLVLYKETFSI